MKYSLACLLTFVSIVAVLVAVVPWLIRDPLSGIRKTGANCAVSEEGVLHVVISDEIAPQHASLLVEAIGGISSPCHLTAVGDISNIDLNLFADLANLHEVSLGESSLSPEEFMSISRFKNLKQITVDQCVWIDSTDVKQFQAARPDVVFRGCWFAEVRSDGSREFTLIHQDADGTEKTKGIAPRSLANEEDNAWKD